MLSCQGMVAASSELTFPVTLGRYELLAPIASGGMATVYLARAGGVGGFSRQVAVKVLNAKATSNLGATATEDLLAEARLAGRIRHRSVVPVIDVGHAEVGYYLVMDYVEGTSLAHLQQAAAHFEQRLPTAIALQILSEALEGLHAAHEAKDEQGAPLGVVHRDFSPQNILVGVDGTTRLTDFGIARSLDRTQYTKTGVVKGKLSYMSPEQAQGLALDRTSDVWAAGVIAWELLSGRRLFDGDPVPTLLKLVSGEPPLLSSVCPDVPLPLAEAVASALVADRQRRCASAEEFRRRLLAACSGRVELASAEEVGEYVNSVAYEQLQRLRAAPLTAGRPPKEPISSSERDQSRASVTPNHAVAGERPWPRRARWTLAGALTLAAALAALALVLATRSARPPEASKETKADPLAKPMPSGPAVTAATSEVLPADQAATLAPAAAQPSPAASRRPPQPSKAQASKRKSTDLAPSPY